MKSQNCSDKLNIYYDRIMMFEDTFYAVICNSFSNLFISSRDFLVLGLDIELQFFEFSMFY